MLRLVLSDRLLDPSLPAIGVHEEDQLRAERVSELGGVRGRVRPELRPVTEEPGVAVELHDRGAGLGRAHRNNRVRPTLGLDEHSTLGAVELEDRVWDDAPGLAADVEARADRVPPAGIWDPAEGERGPPERHAAR